MSPKLKSSSHLLEVFGINDEMLKLLGFQSTLVYL